MIWTVGDQVGQLRSTFGIIREGGGPLSFLWIPGQGLLQRVQIGGGPLKGKGSSMERRMLCLYFIALVHEKTRPRKIIKQNETW